MRSSDKYNIELFVYTSFSGSWRRIHKPMRAIRNLRDTVFHSETHIQTEARQRLLAPPCSILGFNKHKHLFFNDIRAKLA